MSLRVVFAAFLFFLPMIVTWVLLYRISAYRRDAQGLAGSVLTTGIRIFRPDLYTNEGQPLLRWVWAVLLITIPWCVGVALILG